MSLQLCNINLTLTFTIDKCRKVFLKGSGVINVVDHFGKVVIGNANVSRISCYVDNLKCIS